MCIAIVQKPGKKLTRKQLRSCWKENPDGGGFAYAPRTGKNRNEKLMLCRELNSFKAFWKAYSVSVNENPKSVFLVHCRIATSGKVDLNNCHPFVVKPGLAMIHNGIIDIPQTDENKSDTFHFSEAINKLPSPVEDEDVKWLLEEAVGFGNKVAFLDVWNNYTILNEKSGTWLDGIWFSNLHWKTRKVYSTGGWHYGSYYSSLEKPLPSLETNGVKVSDPYARRCIDCGLQVELDSKFPEFCKACEADQQRGFNFG